MVVWQNKLPDFWNWTDKVEREIFSGAHVSTLLPYDPIRKEIVLIQQFRAGVLSRYDDDYLYEIVAGIIDKDEKNDWNNKDNICL